MSNDTIEYFEEEAAPPPPASNKEMTALETWIAAVTEPNVNTFTNIAGQSGASLSKAFLWVLLAFLITAFSKAIAQTAGMGQSMKMIRDMLPPELAREIPANLGSGGGIATRIGAIICGAPLGAIVGVLFFAISVALILWVAKLFGGTGEFEKLAYAFAAIMVPIAVVNGGLALFGMIPFVGIFFGLVSFIVSIYSLILRILAVQAVTGLDSGKSAASVILPWLIVFIFICCCVALFGALFGKALSDALGQMNF